MSLVIEYTLAVRMGLLQAVHAIALPDGWVYLNYELLDERQRVWCFGIRAPEGREFALRVSYVNVTDLKQLVADAEREIAEAIRWYASP